MGFTDYNKKPVIQLFEGITGTFMHTDNMTHGRIHLEAGTDLPEHSHPHEQWTHVLKGKLELTIGGESMILSEGMSAHMPPNVVHSGHAHTDCDVIDCFNPVRSDLVEKEKGLS